jgi:MoaA/NifB/PqqE/SkfB family radical SAM enzyme
MTAMPTGTRRKPATAAPAPAPTDSPRLHASLAPRVRVRKESFGALAYVGPRDHFFALDPAYARLVTALDAKPRPVAADNAGRITTLAELGVVTTVPETKQLPFYGRSLVGEFATLPVSRRPLVVNCLVTAHCPLRCRYCHADDLMVDYRPDEEPRWLDAVVRVARATPAMVGVVTGGEPLSRPDRAERLITALARDKEIVFDTSGVGDFHRVLPLLVDHGVHVRVSMDSASKKVNDALRPINRQYLAPGISSFAQACDTIAKARRRGVACSVQTVVTAQNGTSDDLLKLRDHLVDLGVGTWALHVVVPAGKAATNRTNLLSDASVVDRLEDLVKTSASDGSPIDIRVTSTHRVPNSTLLISAKGELAIQNPTGGAKTTLRPPRFLVRRWVLGRFQELIDPEGHSSRYLNGTLGRYQGT